LVKASSSAFIENAGTKGKRAFLEFFTATICDPNTRRAYGRAVGDFFIWCQRHGFDLEHLEPMVQAGQSYITRVARGHGSALST